MQSLRHDHDQNPHPSAASTALQALLASLATSADPQALVEQTIAGASSSRAALALLSEATKVLVKDVGKSAQSLSAVQSSAHDQLHLATVGGDEAAAAGWQSLLDDIEHVRGLAADTLCAATLARVTVTRTYVRRTLSLAPTASIFTAAAKQPISRDTWGGIARVAEIAQQQVHQHNLPVSVEGLFRTALLEVDRAAGAGWTHRAVAAQPAQAAVAQAINVLRTQQEKAEQEAQSRKQADLRREGVKLSCLPPPTSSASPSATSPTSRPVPHQPVASGSALARAGPSSTSALLPLADTDKASDTGASATGRPSQLGAWPAPIKKKRGRPFKKLPPTPPLDEERMDVAWDAEAVARADRLTELWKDESDATLLGALSLLGIVHVDLDALEALQPALAKVAPLLKPDTPQLGSPWSAEGLEDGVGDALPPRESGPARGTRKSKRRRTTSRIEEIARLLQGAAGS